MTPGATIEQRTIATGDRPAWRRRVEALVDRQEREWHIPRGVHRVLVVAPVLGAAAMAATELYRPLFRWVTAEDGPIEWLQFGVDVAALLGAGLVTAILYRRDLKVAAGLWATFALSQFFIAGEEISWGQRILGHEAPERLRELNHQDETNVHNIRPIQDSINIVFMLVGAYGSVGVLALRRYLHDRSRPAWFDLFVPPVALVSLFGLVFAYKLARLTLFPSPRFVIVKYGEYFELCMAVGLALFAWFSYRRLRTTLDPGADPAT